MNITICLSYNSVQILLKAYWLPWHVLVSEKLFHINFNVLYELISIAITSGNHSLLTNNYIANFLVYFNKISSTVCCSSILGYWTCSSARWSIITFNYPWIVYFLMVSSTTATHFILSSMSTNHKWSIKLFFFSFDW